MATASTICRLKPPTVDGGLYKEQKLGSFSSSGGEGSDNDMCGIAGYFRTAADQSHEAMLGEVGLLTDTMAHRGPDDRGVWADARSGIALGSRRLAVIDPTSKGHQPMTSSSGHALVFNGEIYNAESLRSELEEGGWGGGWEGHSDTEVLFRALMSWGVEATVRRCNGMFGFAYWDPHLQRLSLARDRMGIKPLFYSRQGDWLFFGSEIHALRAHPHFNAELDRVWIDGFLRGTKDTARRTIYESVQELDPATTLTIGADGYEKTESYWSARDYATAQDKPEELDDFLSQLDYLLADAVRIRMVSDVPLGVLLSGGVDSSLVLALAQSQSSQRIKSFSIGFPDIGYDEAPYAREIAEHIGSEHAELYVTASDILEAIPDLASGVDIPIADPSFASVYFAYRLASNHVTVALAGDGGDEVFGGYNRHRWLPRAADAARWIPGPIRTGTTATIRAFKPETLDRIFDQLKVVLPNKVTERQVGVKLHRMATWLASDTPEEMYEALSTRWDSGSKLVIGVEPTRSSSIDDGWANELTLVQRILLHELVTKLPDVQLRKVDRASMRSSVEARVPLLDHRVVETAMGFPEEFRSKGYEGKIALRKVLARYVPPDLTNRPKSGFQLPLGSWLRGPLKPWAQDLLDPDCLLDAGVLEPDLVAREWQAHLSERVDNSRRLWALLMLQSWLRENRLG